MIDPEEVKNFPESPGVYIFKSKGKPIYIGKAKNIKKRLMQHLSGRNEKSSMVVQEADSVDFIQTKNEREALILEANLIYESKPKYNVLLKSTEVYPYIRISDDEFPYVEIVRRRRGKGEFYGPFTNVKFTRGLLEILQRIYGFRTCKKNLKRVKRPCMDYHMGLCLGPCTGKISVEEYSASIDGLRRFLEGDVETVMNRLREMMEHHAEMLDFENAARYRDILMSMEKLMERQGVVLKESKNLDVVVGREGLFVVLRIRGGFLMGKLVYEMGSNLSEFLEHFYTRESEPPDRIVVEEEVELALGSEISPPVDDVESYLLDLARDNLENELRLLGIKKESLKRLAEFAGLEGVPRRIEGVDVSHLMGRGTVASVVVFIDGKPKKDEYRRYRLRDGRIDDYRAIKELVMRRYSKHEVPDILFVDGGMGQVKAAVHGLKKIGKKTVVLGLAKSEERVVRTDGEYRLPHDSPIVRALVAVRDEAHRFAISGNRKIREKESLKSILDEIEGIGPVRKRRILERYKTIEELREAPLDELSRVVGSRKVAERISKLV